ncbi:hypothetical protein SLS60_002317 [Paraconiothyrium brasiliense]|uniref:Uncharacterized protein n=1 Tax=Paraconiothyrium brasiliense TaxID=300254 RepID=A0ABR3S346_9PLEO
MNNISRSVESIRSPNEDIRAYFQDQLSTLRVDILRYEDVSEECRKTQQLKEHFFQQSEMQKKQCEKLEETMRISRQQEADVKARCSFLESELETWKEKSYEHDSESVQTEQEAEKLRKQLEKAREDLREEKTELGRVQQRLEDQAEELSTIKATLGEKETLYQGCINKLAHERDGKDVLLRESQIEKDKLAGDLSHAGSKIRELASEAEQVRDANTQMRKDLQKAQSAAAEASALALELADLERQMMVKSAESRRASDEATSLSSQLASLQQLMAQASEANHSKEDDLKNTKVELTRLVKGAADHAREKDHLKAQLNEHVSTITGLKEKIDAAHRAQDKSVASLKQLQNSTVVMQKEKDQLTLQMSVEQSKLKTLKQELDARDATHRKDVDTLDSLQRRLKTLQEEKEELKSEMERSHANESKLIEAQAEYLSEKEDLQLELAKLQASLESKDIELRRTRADSIERSKTVEENHVAESEELKRRISQIEIALKEAEKTAEHKSRELEAHKKATLEKFDLLVQEALNQQNTRHESQRIPRSEMLLRDPRLQESTSMHAVGSQQRAPSSSEASAFSEEPLEGTVTKGRKKPNRLNLTVLNVSDASRTQSTQLLLQTNAVNDRHRHPDEGIARTGCVHAAAANELGAREMLDENGVSSIYPAGEEPQEPQRTLVYTAGAFDESMKAMNRPGTADTSSSVLSDPLSSDDLIDMDPLEQGTVPISRNNGYEQFQDENVPQSDRYDETPQRSARHSLHHVASFSRDRPKSQANTGSRMLPPATPSAPSTKNYGSPAHARHRIPKKSARSVGGAPSGNTRSSSPDYVHRPVSSHKTYGNYNPSGDSPGALYETHRPSVNRSTTKRKAPRGGALVNVQSKRHRASAHESSSQSTPSSQPAQISQAQSQDPRVVPTPRARRLKGGRRNDEFDAMFDRELQTGPSRRPH